MPHSPRPPRVSALITVRNGERYLQQAVRSILDQDLRDLELVVVDDGSTDRTPAILAELAAGDPRMRVVTQPAMGIPQAANRGLVECRGGFIARMDADDVALPQRFRRQLAYLEETGHVCVGSYVEYIDEKGRYLTTLRVPTEDADIQSRTLRGHGAIYHPSAMIRREALDRIGGYDETFEVALDLDLWLRLGEIGTLGNVPEPLLRYRLHAKSASETRRYRQRELARLACERAWERRGVRGTFEATEPWRPGTDRASRHAFMLQYGWWAFGSGEARTAMIYGGKAVTLLPWKVEGWKLLAATALGRAKKRA